MKDKITGPLPGFPPLPERKKVGSRTLCVRFADPWWKELCDLKAHYERELHREVSFGEVIRISVAKAHCEAEVEESKKRRGADKPKGRGKKKGGRES